MNADQLSKIMDTRPAVYFIQAESLRLIKIGYSGMPWRRFHALQTDSPDKLTLLGFIWSAAASALEQDLHCQFRDHRVRGERFSPHDELLRYIADHAEAPVTDRQALIDRAMARRGINCDAVA